MIEAENFEQQNSLARFIASMLQFCALDWAKKLSELWLSKEATKDWKNIS